MKNRDYTTPNSAFNMKMKNAITDYNREKAEDPNLTHRAFCNTYNLDDGFRTNMIRFMKDPKSLDEGSRHGGNQPNELVQKSETDDWNHLMTTRYSKEELFAKVQGQKTLLNTLAKKEFGGRLGPKTEWAVWLSKKINKPCKAIYAKRAADANEESDDESDAGYDL
jgi:hypothetical protein